MNEYTLYIHCIRFVIYPQSTVNLVFPDRAADAETLAITDFQRFRIVSRLNVAVRFFGQCMRGV